jgi:hypothetical protein
MNEERATDVEGRKFLVAQFDGFSRVVEVYLGADMASGSARAANKPRLSTDNAWDCRMLRSFWWLLLSRPM